MIKQASTKLCLDNHRAGDGSAARRVKLRVTFDRVTKYFPVKTDELLTKSEFDAARSKRYKDAMEKATPCLTAAAEICSKLGSAFDWSVFDSRYRQWYDDSMAVSSADTFITLMNEYLESKPFALKTRESYRIAVSWMEKYRPGARLCDVDVQFMLRLNTFIRNEHGVDNPISENSIRNYFRTYRALMNYAIKTGKYTGDNPVPGAYNGTLASTAREKGALSEDEFLRLKKYVPKTADEEFSKDFWLAIVAMSGANVGDILKLRNRNIQGDRIVYIRTKSRRNGLTINIPLTDYLRVFFNKYGKIRPGCPNDYVLRFLANTRDDTNVKNRIHTVIRRINVGLRDIFKEIGIDSSQAVSYSARHTFSVFAMSRGISHGELQKFLGHASVKTTEVYLRSITTTSIEKDRTFLDGILK